MKDLSDFMPPESDGPTPVPESPPAAGPLVVIQYQNRGPFARLATPLLILLVALAVTYYERKKSARLAEIERRSSFEAAAVRPSVDPEKKPPAIEGEPNPPAGDRVGPDSPTVTEVAPPEDEAVPRAATVVSGPPEPASIPPPSPFEIDPADGLVPMEAASVPRVADATLPSQSLTAPAEAQFRPADPPPPPPREAAPALAEGAGAGAIVDDIKREAAENADEQKGLQELKSKFQEMLLADALKKVHGSRAPFREELKDILDHFKGNAGPEIERLCKQFGRDSLAEAQELYNRGRRMLSARISRRDEVEFMRVCGLPETVILDYLSHKLHPTMNTRGGPRDANEVRIRAARLLLSYTPGGEATPAPTGPNRPLTSAAAAGR